MDSITVLFVYMVCQGGHDELRHLHQKGRWFVFEVVIPACIFNVLVCTLCKPESEPGYIHVAALSCTQASLFSAS